MSLHQNIIGCACGDDMSSLSMLNCRTGTMKASDIKDDAPRPAVHAGVRLSEPALWLDRVSRWLRDGERQSSTGGNKKSTAASL